ncbi:MAG TPA: antitoxin [archaeon]|nr:antitoxin [archaeon]
MGKRNGKVLYILGIYMMYIKSAGGFMVQAMVEIQEKANQILNIVKARHNLKTKSQAINRVVLEYGSNLLETQLKPKYLLKLSKIEKEKGIPFKNIGELRKLAEG